LPLVFICTLVFTACNLQPAHVPMPAQGSGFEQPVVKPFKFSDSVPFQFKVTEAYSKNPPKVLPLDLDKLSAKPFALNDFKPLKAPIQQIKLRWDNMPDSMLNIDILPSTPFVVQQSILPKPAMVKAGLPKLLPNTTTGILQFSGEEGLPGTRITASLLDKYGSTWLATEKGLCRYTGEYLYIYSFVDKTLQGNEFAIIKMALDHNGNIWMVTGGNGIYVIDLTANILLHNKSNLYSSDIICDHEGQLWVSTYLEGILIIDPEKQTVKNLRKVKESINTNAITAIAEDRDYNIWLGHPDHIAIIDSQRKSLKNITTKEGLPATVIVKFFEDSNGDMWAARAGEGISFISLKSKTLSTIDSKNGMNGVAVEVVEDSRRQVWLFRRDTSYILNKQRTAVRQVIMDIKMGLQNLVGSALIDRNGSIWLGTLNKGAIIIDTKGPLAEHLTTEQGLADNNVWSIIEDNQGKIWMATRQGINVYNPGNGKISVIGEQQGPSYATVSRLAEDGKGNIVFATDNGFAIVKPILKSISIYSKEQGFSNMGFTKCTADSAGQLWFSSSLFGLISYNINTNTFKNFDRSTGLLSNIVWDYITDKQQNIWVATDSGITVVNTVNNTIKYLRVKEGLCNDRVYKLVQRANGEIWAGTIKGISIINTNKLTITNLTSKEGLLAEEIYDMAEQNGAMYAGSSAGLYVIREPGTIGNDTKLWSLSNYGKREGFPYNDYNQNTGTTTRNGQTWWGITPVLTVVTQQPIADTLLPQVTITGINIMDQPLSFATYASMGNRLKAGDTLWNETKTAYYLKNKLPKDSGYLVSNTIRWDSTTSYYKIPVGLVLPHHQNSVNFSFINNDVKGREKILYRYILEGADDKWSDASDKSSTRNYFNLTAGQYTFKVSTRGFNGLWSNTGQCSFTILPPWWKTWWAYILYVLLAAGVISAFARYRSRQLLQKNNELEEKIKQRTTELSKSINNLKSTQAQLIQSEKMASLGELTAGIAHEIQNPLNFVNNFSEVNSELLEELKSSKTTLNSEQQDDLLLDIFQNNEKINHHGKRADSIVKGMLQHSRTSKGQKEPTDINALADEYLRLCYHGLRTKDQTLHVTIKTDFDTSIGNININPQDIGRVLLNLYNNAFYACAGRSRSAALVSAVAEGEFKNPDYTYEPTVIVTTKKVPASAMADRSGGGGVIISIRDNGPGIPPNIIDKIFQPFFTTKPTGQFTGLGLSLSYDIVTKGHGGTLRVNTKVGEGSEFIVELPS